MLPTYATPDRPEKPADGFQPSSWVRTGGVQSTPMPGAPVVRTAQPQPQGEVQDLSASLPPRRLESEIPAWRGRPVSMTASMPPPDDHAVGLLLNAARSGREAIDLLLRVDPRLNAKDADGRTAFHLATLEDDVTTADHLIAFSAGFDTVDRKGRTPLMDAARRGSHLMVQTLVDAGAKIKMTDNAGRSTLSHAAEGGNVDCINLLWKRSDPAVKDEKGQTPLHHAARHGRTDAAMRLLAGNADINAADDEGNTPVLIAASQNHLDLVDQLLSNPTCKPMTRNGAGCNIYVEACNAINLPLLDLLLKHKVRIEHFECNLLLAEAAMVGAGEVMLKLQAQGGVVPNVPKSLFAAIEAGHDSVVDALVNGYQADPNQENGRACTALQHAVMLGKHDAARCLLAKGANINHPSHSQPLLCLAVQAGNIAMVDVLLQQKPVALNMVNSALKTPLTLAAETGRAELASCLCEAGFDVNFAPPAMPLPVEVAALGGHVAVLALLHQKGANYPDTLLKEAVARGQVAVVEQLLETGADPLKAGIDPKHVLVSPAMMELIMHASAPDDAAKSRLLDGSILHAQPAKFVPLLTAMMDANQDVLVAWLKNQGIRSILWAPVMDMLKTMRTMREAGCLGSPENQVMVLKVSCAALLSRQVYSDHCQTYRKAGLSKIAAQNLSKIADLQVAAIRKAAGLWLKKDCLSHIAELTERCLGHTSLTFVSSDALATYWTKTAGLLPPVAQRLADCWRRALAQVVAHARFNGALTQFQSDLAAKLEAAFSAQFRSLQSDGSFYASTSANAPEAYHALIVEQLDWVQQACDASTKLAAMDGSAGTTSGNMSEGSQADGW